MWINGYIFELGLMIKTPCIYITVTQHVIIPYISIARIWHEIGLITYIATPRRVLKAPSIDKSSLGTFFYSGEEDNLGSIFK
uniref:Uncharacterized protein n=1 Tax=Kalanchoe fedtschenkoi TaxID=63787 RepID=A0A7N0T123_KALFE